MFITKLTEEKIKEIAKAFKNKAGNVSMTCDDIGITRATWYNWIKDNEEFKKAIEEVKDSMIDLAESQLFKNIINGKEVSLIFYLKNKKPDEWKDRMEQRIEGRLMLIDANK